MLVCSTFAAAGNGQHYRQAFNTGAYKSLENCRLIRFTQYGLRKQAGTADLTIYYGERELQQLSHRDNGLWHISAADAIFNQSPKHRRAVANNRPTLSYSVACRKGYRRRSICPLTELFSCNRRRQLEQFQ